MRRKDAKRQEQEDARWLAVTQVDAFTPTAVEAEPVGVSDVPEFCPGCHTPMGLASGWTVRHEGGSTTAATLWCGKCGATVRVPADAARSYAQRVEAHFAAKVAAMRRKR